MCSHWKYYLAAILNMCLMPLMVCAWWLFLILLTDSWTDKPLWLDGHLWLVDKLVFHIKTELEYISLRVYILCHDPSHGGSYMAEGAYFIRIGLPPCVVPGDFLNLSLYGLIWSLSWPFARACSMSDVRWSWGCNSTFHLSFDYARGRPLSWYSVSHDGLCTILRRTAVLPGSADVLQDSVRFHYC